MESITKGIEKFCFSQHASELQTHQLTGKLDARLADVLSKKSIVCGLVLGQEIAIKYVCEDESDLIIDLFFTPVSLIFQNVTVEDISAGLELSTSAKKEFSKCSSNSSFYAEQELDIITKDIKKAITLEYLDELYKKENPAFIKDCFYFFFEKNVFS